jgi:hypothetical protein
VKELPINSAIVRCWIAGGRDAAPGQAETERSELN